MRKTIAAVILALSLSPRLSLAAQMEVTVVGLDRGKGQVFVMTPEGRKNLKVKDSVLGMEHLMQGAKLLVIYSESDGTLNVSKISSASGPGVGLDRKDKRRLNPQSSQLSRQK